jgi:hypothetical protein
MQRSEVMIGRSHASSPCGLHITRTDPCIHCARAAVNNAAALAEVVATHKNGQPLKRTEAVVREIRMRVAAGETIASVARSLGMDPSVCGKVASGYLGTTETSEANRKRAHQRGLPIKGEQEHRRAQALPRNVRL